MEAQKPKIALYVQRSFGEKLTATFDFIKENWKPLMKFTTYLMLPLCLLQGLSLNGLMSGTMALGDMTGGSFDSSVVGASIMALVTYYSLYAVLYLLGTVMLTSLVYALVRTYNEREKRLEGVTLGMLKPLLFRNVRRVFLIMIVGVLLVLFVGLIVGFIATVHGDCVLVRSARCGGVCATCYLGSSLSVRRYLYHRCLEEGLPTGFRYLGRYRTDFHCYGIHRRHLAGSDDDSMVYRDYCEIYLCND